jgi:hypothetical protein
MEISGDAAQFSGLENPPLAFAQQSLADLHAPLAQG